MAFPTFRSQRDRQSRSHRKFQPQSQTQNDPTRDARDRFHEQYRERMILDHPVEKNFEGNLLDGNGNGVLGDEGYGELEAGTTPVDQDQDGMPDRWELERGLDPNDALDRNGDAGGDGYTHLEDHLNELAVRAFGS